ncbi:MAG: hypothetical protein QXM00_12225 [Candidatus Bathyarchaeia archaeon]
MLRSLILRLTKIVAQMAAGYDNIGVLETTKRGVHIATLRSALTETTANFHTGSLDGCC